MWLFADVFDTLQASWVEFVKFDALALIWWMTLLLEATRCCCFLYSYTSGHNTWHHFALYRNLIIHKCEKWRIHPVRLIPKSYCWALSSLPGPGAEPEDDVFICFRCVAADSWGKGDNLDQELWHFSSYINRFWEEHSAQLTSCFCSKSN